MNAQATQPKHISTYQRYSPKQSSKRHIPRATHADQEESKRDRIREMRIRQFACIINEHKKKIKLLESS